MWFPGLSGELSFPGALGEGGHWSEEPRVGGCLNRASRQEERPPPPRLRVPQEQRYRGQNWSRPQGSECLGGEKIRQRTGMSSRELGGLGCHTGKCGQGGHTNREGLYRRPEKNERECGGREGRPPGKIKREKRWWRGEAGGLGFVPRQ